MTMQRIPAVVFASLRLGELRLILLPGVGMVDGGVPVDVPADLVPPDCRFPNTLLWVTTRGSEFVAVERRSDP